MQTQLITTPVFDGHFWVIRDNQIIDPHFSKYDTIAAIRGVKNTKNYHPAPMHVQMYFINLFRKYWAVIKQHSYSVRANMCPYNAFFEVEKNGGLVVFGSMGFGEGSNIFWEYGDPKWTTAKNFLKRK